MKKMQLKALAAMSVAVVGLAGTLPASAQSSPGGWQYELTPYLWTTGLKGAVQTPSVPRTEVDMSFSDLFDSLDFAFSGTLEARKGKWGLIGDLQYYKLSAGGTTSSSGPLGLTVAADVELKQTILAAAAAYRVVEGSSPVDVVGGLRYTNLDVDVTANFSALGLTGGGIRSGSESWVDPYIGLRVQHPLSDRWSMMAYADIGGFGAGADFTWQALAGLQYRVSDKYAIKFGYRVLDVDYEKDGFVYDMQNEGLFFGLGIRF